MRAGSRSPGIISAALPLGPVVSTANPALQLQDHIPGSREDADFNWAPPGASRWASLCRSWQPGRLSLGSSQGSSTSQPQLVASASPGVNHRRPALLTSAQRCSCFVTPARPRSGPLSRQVPVAWVHLRSSSSRSGGLNRQPGSTSSGSHPWHPGGC
ncbi:hypothetical protein NDU88_001252 [Pleurodeles waltl]|uniref:Uncharacterized protein n=1 Tax=Pleurodeles waltl TaxID=8319 RepID=A0AAV7NA82_PLEWA|nr:hypothetical protein NDU88_001252 [Pleurodeles waltl]